MKKKLGAISYFVVAIRLEERSLKVYNLLHNDFKRISKWLQQVFRLLGRLKSANNPKQSAKILEEVATFSFIINLPVKICNFLGLP